ncbi:S-layer homology domain-containing protein [Paenibacillus monticola]|uniref:SLH domain-containing protein n=1 Tax=Paenibacillus monticola TaxID=2666075 RepID=A0A7X2H166_9BACL|nr:S-layer homology domain-containing protein [Paenibacillus monticola]MRN51650.1 hypothetical protein [Paenibacillus monticola]
MNLVSLSQVFAASTNANKVDDITGHWAESTLKQWQEKGLITGYEDGSIQPNHKITRAEFAVLINKSFGFKDTATIDFKDVKHSDWFYTDIAKATSAGYIKGYPNQTFKPNQSLSREEMAVIVTSLLQLKGSVTPTVFTDTTAGHEWSKGPIGAIVEAGLMVGYGQKFNPLTSATRAEAVSVLDRALKFSKDSETVVYNQAGNYGPETGVTTITGSVYIDAPGIVLSNTIITGDLLIGEGVGKGDVSLKNVTVRGTTTITGGGKNSIHVIDSTLITVIVNKKDGSIRIITEGSGSVQQITLQSGALLEEGTGTGSGFDNVDLSGLIPANSQVTLAGTFETVDVYAAAIQVNLNSGSIQELQVAPGASNTGINISSGASLTTLILNAVARVTGQGSIGTAVINVSGSTITQTPNHVTRADNISVTIGSPAPNGGNPNSVTEIVYGFEGTITDVNHQPVADLTIQFRKGLGNTTGAISGTVVTDINGHYFASLSPGIYTGQLVKAGYITTYVIAASLTDYKNTLQDATAIRIPAADEIRIVLTWDLLPLDEDSHLVGPAANNKFFHTWYADNEYTKNNVLYADLDHDDTNSYGPETTTIRKRVDGTYTFYIVNFSGNGQAGLDTLSASGAKVEVYNGDNAVPVKTYQVPAGAGNQLYWHVFNMSVDGNNLTFEDKNELTNTQPLANVDFDLDSQLPDSYAFSVENHPGATDVVKLNSLSPGDIVSVYTNETGPPIQSEPVQEGSDTTEITGLDFGANERIIYVTLTSPGLDESRRLTVPVISEANYTELSTTIANAFADKEVPGTLSVGDVVYLQSNPLQVFPSDLVIDIKSLEYYSPTSVSDTVYLYKDYSNIRYLEYNGTNEPIKYKVTLELRRGFATTNKEFILTVPTVFSALQQSVNAAHILLNNGSFDAALQEAMDNANEVLNNPNSTVQEYLTALIAIHSALDAVAGE